MNMYVGGNGFRLTGKAWEIRHRLRSLAAMRRDGAPMTVAAMLEPTRLAAARPERRLPAVVQVYPVT